MVNTVIGSGEQKRVLPKLFYFPIAPVMTQTPFFWRSKMKGWGSYWRVGKSASVAYLCSAHGLGVSTASVLLAIWALFRTASNYVWPSWKIPSRISCYRYQCIVPLIKVAEGEVISQLVLNIKPKPFPWCCLKAQALPPPPNKLNLLLY